MKLKFFFVDGYFMIVSVLSKTYDSYNQIDPVIQDGVLNCAS